VLIQLENIAGEFTSVPMEGGSELLSCIPTCYIGLTLGLLVLGLVGNAAVDRDKPVLSCAAFTRRGCFINPLEGNTFGDTGIIVTRSW